MANQYFVVARTFEQDDVKHWIATVDIDIIRDVCSLWVGDMTETATRMFNEECDRIEQMIIQAALDGDTYELIGRMCDFESFTVSSVNASYGLGMFESSAKAALDAITGDNIWSPCKA